MSIIIRANWSKMKGMVTSIWTFRRSLRQGLWLIPWEIGSLDWLLGILEKQSGAAGGFGLGYLIDPRQDTASLWSSE